MGIGVSSTVAFIMGLGVSLHARLKSGISVPHSPVGLLNISLIGFQSQTFGGLTSPVKVPRVVMLGVGHEPFVAQR